MKKNSKLLCVFVCLLALTASLLSGCAGRYTLTFETNGGTAVESVSFKGGGKITPPVTEKEFFTFDKWYADEQLTVPFDFDKLPDSDATAYAGWIAEERGRIAFNSNGGSAVEDLVGTVGESIEQSLLPVPVKEGYAFQGWCTEDGAVYSFGQFTSGTLTLYAKWGKDSAFRYVTFLLNDDKWETAVPVGGKVAEPQFGDDVTCEWYVGAQSTELFDFQSAVDNDVTLYGERASVGLIFDGGSVTGYAGSAAYVYVPSRSGEFAVTAIGDDAFKGNVSLERIYLPSSVTSVGSCAFYGCTRLAYAELGSVEEMGDFAFAGCVKLSGKADLSKLTAVPDDAFENCLQLSEVQFGQTLVSIGESAFCNCKALTAVDIPDSVGEILSFAFADSGLVSANIPASLTSLGKSVFKGCNELTLGGGSARYVVDEDNGLLTDGNNRLVLHFTTDINKDEDSYTLPARFTSVEAYAFWGNDTIETLDLGSSALEKSSLEGMLALTSLTVKDFDASNPFVAYWFGATSPERNTSNGLYVPSTLKEITFTAYSSARVAQRAFFGCNGLQSVEGLDNVTQIDEYAFAYTSFESYQLSDKIVSFDNTAFRGAPLRELSVAEGNTHYAAYDGALYDNALSKLIYVPSSKTEINFAPSVGVVASGAMFQSNVGELIVPASVSEIEFGALEGMQNLVSLTVPFIGGSKTDNTYMLYVFGGTVRTTSNGNIEVSAEKCPPRLKRINIDGTVAQIPANAFAYCASVSEFGIGDDYTEIGSAAFYNTALTEVVIPDGVGTIGNYAFYDSDDITSVVIGSGVTSVGDLAFAVIANLESVAFAEGSADLTIGNGAFLAESRTDSSTGDLTVSSRLTSLKLSNNVVEIGQSAFTYAGVNGTFSTDGDDVEYYFFELVFDAAQSRLKKLGTSAFGVSAVTKVTLPASLEEIGLIAFSGCDYLSEVTIGSAEHPAANLVRIVGGAFAENPRMRSFTLYKSVASSAEVPQLADGSGILFDSTHNDVYRNGISVFAQTSAQIYVPADSVDAYKSAWNTTLNKLADYIVAIREA